MTNPFDFVNAISSNKNILENNPDAEKDYSPFMTNRSMSNFLDTLFYANEMNKFHNLDNKLQFDFLINSIRPAKRWSKWFKKDKNEVVELIMEYFNYNRRRAEEVLPILTPEDIKLIKTKMNKGGENECSN